MSPFYRPLSLTINTIPTIIYPMIGLEGQLPNTDDSSIFNYVQNLYQENKDQCIKGKYHIVILWVDAGQVMTDIWQFLSLESEGSGYIVDCITFKDLKLITGNGITASDGLIMLGKETEHSEQMRRDGKSVTDYVFGNRPKLPNSINPTVPFYQS